MRGIDQTDDVVPSETMLVAARVLNTLAAACLAVAIAALGVMFIAWLGSADQSEYREWPDGIAGWLVCVPALAAATTLAVAALGMRNPVFWD
ncbi:MAG: hypothetical protein Q8Q02_00890 [Nocardioides sp.]|nr:hypothetical protein [Nocardioides sp.]